MEFYGGEQIHKKHSNYATFLKSATADEKKYFAFSGIRNPLDRTVSDYVKYVTNHLGEYTDPKKLDHMARGKKYSFRRWYFLRRFKYIQSTKASFEQYFLKFFRWPYDDWSCLDHHKMGLIIRFENIQQDFSAVLERLNITPARPIPVYNKTEGRQGKSFLDYYASPAVRERAIKVFGPFMEKWGYTFPDDWGANSVSTLTRAKHVVANAVRVPVWRYR
jgi:hypothetical protein